MNLLKHPDEMQTQQPTVLNKNGPIIIIEDDADDQEILTDIFKTLNSFQ
jgi:hypothetical protein